MDYKGVIIEESLKDKSIINEFKVLEKDIERVSERDNTPWLKEWTMDTVLIDSSKIDEYALRLSKLIEVDHCSDWYCDFKNEKFHYVIFANKVFKLERNNKSDYLEMQEYASSLGLPKEQMPNFNDLPINLLIGFLIEAKKATYANQDAPKVMSSRIGSRDYHYQDNIEGEEMSYHGTYFGGSKFMGEEVVYRGSDSPKWGMNYYGVTLDESIAEEALDEALRPALLKVGEDREVLPVRGPKRFQNGEFLYTFNTRGDMNNFTGVEEIYKGDKLVYRLICSGGIIE